MDINRNCCNDLRKNFSCELSNSNKELLFKVLIIGDVSVGKSSVLQRFVENMFKHVYATTIGVDFKTMKVKHHGKFVKLQIWDTAGHERFRSMTSAFYRGAHGVVLVYDVTRLETFTNIPQWLKDLDFHGCNHVVKILFGNKCDVTSPRAVSREMAFKYADSQNMSVYETSAKTGDQVNEGFLNLISRMIECSDEGAAGRACETGDLRMCLLNEADEVEQMLKPCLC